MVGRKSRTGRSNGLFSRVYSPIGHGLRFGRNTTNTVTKTARNLGRLGFSRVNNIGKSFTGHLNGMIRNVFTRKASRKNRRSTRKNRR